MNLTSVRRILENSEYLGCVVNGRKKKLSFKSKRVISVAQDKWIVADNTHEPIISQQLWDDAHRRLGSRKRTGKKGSANIFAGLVKCDKCGYALTIANTKASKHYFSCSTYKRKGKEACTVHYLKYDDLYQIVLADIQEKLCLIHCNEEAFARRLQSELGSMSGQKAQLARKEVQETLDDNILQFMDAVRKYTDVQELDRELLNRLIDKIVVGNKVKTVSGYTQKITIYYRFIGDLEGVDLSM